MERKRLFRVLIMTGAFLLPSFVGMLLVCLWNGGRGVPLPRFLQLLAEPFGVGGIFYAVGDPSRLFQAIVVGIVYIPFGLLILLCMGIFKLIKFKWFRDLLFLDKPEQGAFLGLTLLPICAWGIFSAWCIIWRIDCLSAFALTLDFFACYKIGSIQNTSLFLYVAGFSITSLIIVGGYSIFLLARLPIICCMQSIRQTLSRKNLFMVVGLFTLSLVYGVCVHFNSLFYWQWVFLASTLVASILLLRPIIFSWRFWVGTISWIGAFLIFQMILAYVHNTFAENIFELIGRMAVCFPFHEHLFHWARLDTSLGCASFVLFGFLQIAIGYLLYGQLIASHAGVSLRRMFSRGIRVLWGIVAASYIAFLGLALFDAYTAHQAITKLEASLGHPLTMSELSRQFYSGRPASPEFWDRLTVASRAFSETENEISFLCYKYPFIFLPEKINKRQKAIFKDSIERIDFEGMLNRPLPSMNRNYADSGSLMRIQHCELLVLKKAVQMEIQCIRYALEEDNFEEASIALNRIDICEDYLANDFFATSYLMWLDIGLSRLEILAGMVGSGLCPDKWLIKQDRLLSEEENQISIIEKRTMFGEMAIALDHFHHPSCNKCIKEKVSNSLNLHSMHIFFPQAWWLATNCLKKTVNAFFTPEFSESIPRGKCVCIDIVFPWHSRIAYLKKRFIASNRILRCLIKLELQKRKTGSYPDVFNELLNDPYSTNVLRYKKGFCFIQNHALEEVEHSTGDNAEIINEPFILPLHAIGANFMDSGYGDIFSATSVGRLDANNDIIYKIDVDGIEKKYKLTSKEDSVYAVQVWSVGLNGVDDDERRGQSNDDIRFIIMTKP